MNPRVAKRFNHWARLKMRHLLLALLLPAVHHPSTTQAIVGDPGSTATLAAVILPKSSEAGETRLAVQWRGERAARLELVAIELDRERPVDAWVVSPGLAIVSTAAEPGVGDWHLRARGEDGRLLVESSVQPMPALIASTAAPLDAVRHPADGEPADDLVTAASSAPVAWKPTFGHNSGPSGAVSAMVIHDDGTGPALVIGGRFRVAGGMRVNGVARWNGTSWTPLGGGVSGGPDPAVRTMIVHDGDLIVAGSFTSAGGNPALNIARWDGSAWTGFGAGLNDRVWTLAVHDGQIVAGGAFTTAGSGSALRIARWNGIDWQPVGAGFNSAVRALVVHAGQLIAGGEFTASGGSAVNRVARWNGTSWQPLGDGLSGVVNTLLSHAGLLYAGGNALAQSPIYPVMRFDGVAWQRPGTTLSGGVWAMTVHQGTVVVADEQAIRRWNGNDWTPMAAYTDAPVLALVPDGPALYAGGNLGALEGVIQTDYIARYAGGAWQPFGTSPGPQATPLGVVDGVLTGRVTRYFSESQLLPVVSQVHRWIGGAWIPVPGVFVGSVLAVTAFDGQLVAAGDFSSVDGEAIANVARWNGSQWVPLGAGLGGPVRGLTVHDGALIALGSFNADGTGNPMARIARWNGAQWQAMGTLTDLVPSPEALATFEGELVVAGYDFDSVPVGGGGRVARWNGAAWLPIGSQLPHRIRAVATHDGALYVTGGFFTNQTHPAVHRWTGGNWVAEGPQLTGPNIALASHDGVLYAGGRGGLARRIGTAWDLPFAGPEISRLLSFGADLVVSGDLNALEAVPSRGAVAIGPSESTTTSIVSASPIPAPEGLPITIRVEVSAASSPTRGHVTIIGAPGGACSDLTLSALDATRAQAECAIAWNSPGTRTLRAHYVGASDGAITWAGSVSPGFTVEVIAERLLVDGFDPSP